MKRKKVTIIVSYDYEDKNTVCNSRIADRIKRDLLRGTDTNHEKIESVVVEDFSEAAVVTEEVRARLAGLTKQQLDELTVLLVKDVENILQRYK